MIRTAKLIQLAADLVEEAVAIADESRRAALESKPPLDIETVRPEPRAVYEIPGPPPIESELTDKDGDVWAVGRRLAGDAFVRLLSTASPLAKVGETMAWADFLDMYGPAKLNDQDPRDAELYGPWGARWGNPNEPCPFFGNRQNVKFVRETWRCAFGFGHIGDHVDNEGFALQRADGGLSADGEWPWTTPHMSSATPCTCDHPEWHQPGCPRYEQLAGGAR